MKTAQELIPILRKIIQESKETYNRLKAEGKESHYQLGKSAAADQILRAIDAKPEIDRGLVIEAENLIPRAGDFTNHELNRVLHHYNASAKEGNWEKFVSMEYSLRNALIRARLEVYGKFEKSP